MRPGLRGRGLGCGLGEKSALLGGSVGGERDGFFAGTVGGFWESSWGLGENSALLGGTVVDEGRDCFAGTAGDVKESWFDTGGFFSCGDVMDEKDEMGTSGSGLGLWRLAEGEILVDSVVFLGFALLEVEGSSVAVFLALLMLFADSRPEDANCVSSSSPLLAPLDPLLLVSVPRFDEQLSRWRCSSLRSGSSFSESELCELRDVGGELSSKRLLTPRALSWPGKG